jgi:hypothetical protein
MSIPATGCYGSFNLVRKVWKFNGTLGDKWINEVGFLVMSIVPVYGIAGFVDALVLNSVEFWTGENPVSASNDQRVVPVDGETTLTFRANTIELMQQTDRGDVKYVFEKSDNGTVVKNAEGKFLVRCEMTEGGGMQLTDASGKVISNYSAADVQKFSERMLSAN